MAAAVIRVIHFERIDSTNAEARRLADAGERGPLWIVADEQTAGRGRLGRSWVSEPGNLYATFMTPLPAGLSKAGQISFVAALAVHDVVCELVPSAEVKIKWPNDVLIGAAKICGLLSEVIHGEPAVIAIGCGINVAHAPTTGRYAATALSEHGSHASPSDVLRALDARLKARLVEWNGGRGFDRIRQSWSDRAIGLGGMITVSSGGRDRSGRFAALGEDGSLILENPQGERFAVHAGDVRFAELEEMRQATP
jgi:BirA family biotin operon repressor/biotin-[acetyl-CoA-carboxylase] ligase